MGQEKHINPFTEGLYGILDEINGEKGIRCIIDNCNEMNDIKDIEKNIDELQQLLPELEKEIKEKVEIEKKIINYIEKNGGMKGKKYATLNQSHVDNYRSILESWFIYAKPMIEPKQNSNEAKPMIEPKQNSNEAKPMIEPKQNSNEQNEEDEDEDITLKKEAKEDIKNNIEILSSDALNNIIGSLFGFNGNGKEYSLFSNNRAQFIKKVEKKLAKLSVKELENCAKSFKKVKEEFDLQQILQTPEQSQCIKDIKSIITDNVEGFKNFILGIKESTKEIHNKHLSFEHLKKNIA